MILVACLLILVPFWACMTAIGFYVYYYQSRLMSATGMRPAEDVMLAPWIVIPFIFTGILAITGIAGMLEGPNKRVLRYVIEELEEELMTRAERDKVKAVLVEFCERKGLSFP